MYYGGKWPIVHKEDGFTFIEVMITLSISAAMLVITMITLGGQQRGTQFSQGMRDLESKVQDVMNDVSTGFYPNSTVGCIPNYSEGPTFNSAVVEQGSNIGCMYVGKAIQFRQDKIVIYTLVGNRFSSAVGRTQSSSFSVSRPVIATHLTEEKAYLWGITTKEMYTDALLPVTNSALVVFASTTNATGSPAGTSAFNSGVQRISPLISGIPESTAIQTTSAGADITPTILRSLTSWVAGDRLTVCFEDATGGAGRLAGGLIVEGGTRNMLARLQLESDSQRCT